MALAVEFLLNRSSVIISHRYTENSTAQIFISVRTWNGLIFGSWIWTHFILYKRNDLFVSPLGTRSSCWRDTTEATGVDSLSSHYHQLGRNSLNKDPRILLLSGRLFASPLGPYVMIGAVDDIGHDGFLVRLWWHLTRLPHSSLFTLLRPRSIYFQGRTSSWISVNRVNSRLVFMSEKQLRSFGESRISNTLFFFSPSAVVCLKQFPTRLRRKALRVRSESEDHQSLICRATLMNY